MELVKLQLKNINMKANSKIISLMDREYCRLKLLSLKENFKTGKKSTAF
jgi:hypothetical protein